MRIPGKGLIDRSRPVRFRFDGRDYSGFKGDTLASALLANGERLVARSFKYHRPRGVLTAGSEEPNALVEVLDSLGRTPNVRATMQEIFEGLESRSQNRLGSLRFDLLAVNDYLAPFLGAGFYYKTFLWPQKLWTRLYEPIIRRAAGLGALSGHPDEGCFEKAWAHCDVLVIGAGPSGLMAALTAARAGADVILAEEEPLLGGQLLSEPGVIGEGTSAAWIAAVEAELRALPNVRIMTRTTVTGAYDGGTFGALERVGLHCAARADLPRECFWRIVAGKAILASGAHERHIAFPENDRPGVMLAGAVRSYLHKYGVATGQRVTLFAANDHARATARDLIAAGVKVAAIIDPRKDASSVEDCQVHLGAEVIKTWGRQGLSEITVRKGSEEFQIETDCLAVSGGWNPALHLTCHMNGRPRWSEDLAAFVPMEGAVPGLRAVGAANGSFSTHGALSSGKAAAEAALTALGIAPVDMPLPASEDMPRRHMAFWQVDAPGRAWLDFANDVTTKDVRQAATENFRSVEHMKRYTTQGMAPDQGKNSNVAALAILADSTGRGIAETGVTTFRPPYVPVSLAAMGDGGRGKGLAPARLLISDQAARDRGATMIETGLWYRPGWFPKPGEVDWRESCDREVLMVRNRVGVIDVSSLGKIDLQGRDVGRFLDLIYANRMSSLGIGKVRYGLMLREDGFVMDDGTVARLGQDHWLITTTTGAAEEVLRHIDFMHQSLAADWDLRLTSVTEAWAQFAVTGPEAFTLINSLVSGEGPDLPFMGCCDWQVGQVAARLFRISFTGERGYEIAVPVDNGDALWRDLVARAETLGGGAFGIEALNVLRIEKGFLTHAEIDGRVTAFDLGLEKMLSPSKTSVGKVAAQREGLRGDERFQLVGLRGTEAIPGGAHLFRPGQRVDSAGLEGHVTSPCYSPVLQQWIALAFVKNGRARMGERLRLVDHMRQTDAEVEVVAPVFYDPEGGRMRG